MLTIMLDASDDQEAVELNFEHSLVSLSSWESKYERPFFGRDEKTTDETLDYIRMMLLTKNAPEDYVLRLNNDQIEKIALYINSKQTATTFREAQNQGARNQEQITSELIYYWLVQFQIPFQPVESWHLNRLMTLVKISGVKQTKPKKMSAKEIAEQNRALNEQRRKDLGTSG